MCRMWVATACPPPLWIWSWAARRPPRPGCGGGAVQDSARTPGSGGAGAALGVRAAQGGAFEPANRGDAAAHGGRGVLARIPVEVAQLHDAPLQRGEPDHGVGE